MRNFPAQLCAIVLTAGVAYSQNSVVEPELTPAADDEQAYYEPGGETFIGTGSVAWNAKLRDNDQARALQEARERKMMYHQIAAASGPMPSHPTVESFLKANPPVAAPPLQGQRPVTTYRQERPGEEVPDFEPSYSRPATNEQEPNRSSEMAPPPVASSQEKPGFLSKLFKKGDRENDPEPQFASPYTAPSSYEEMSAEQEPFEGITQSEDSYEPLEPESTSYGNNQDTRAMDDALAQATNFPSQGENNAGDRQPGFLSRLFDGRKREMPDQPSAQQAEPPAPAASTRPPGFTNDPSVSRALGEGDVQPGEEGLENDVAPESGTRPDGGIPDPPAPGQ